LRAIYPIQVRQTCSGVPLIDGNYCSDTNKVLEIRPRGRHSILGWHWDLSKRLRSRATFAVAVGTPAPVIETKPNVLERTSKAQAAAGG
jgi:hypothetical protein